tara:strand:+ start:3745 stop:4188 length:444 start_codon:yes stop_codon:yes gene_type:complete
MNKDNIKINNMKDDNTSSIHNFNLLNYYTIWCLTWYVLYKLNIVKLNPLSIYLLIFVPSTYITIIYLFFSKDTFIKYFIIILLSFLSHYGPIIDLLRDKNFNIKKVINIEIILVNLILINLYICYLNEKNLDMNKLYKDIYLNNKLL